MSRMVSNGSILRLGALAVTPLLLQVLWTGAPAPPPGEGKAGKEKPADKEA